MPRLRKYGPYLTAGALELRRYLDERGISVPRFCEDNGIDRVQTQRMLNGQRKRVALDFAVEIERATHGHVSVMRWNEPANLQATGTDGR